MDKAPALPADWSLIQSFLAVAETGSLSAAATALGQSQPTLGRHIKALEEGLGLTLFARHARGLRVTAAGQSILPAAQAMRAAMHQIGLVAEAQSETLAGTVRIASSVFAAHHLLPDLIARLRREVPEVSIIVHASDDSDNLLFREADIALRMYRPTQLELVTKHIGDIPLGIFAAKTYLQRRGVPRDLAAFLGHDLIGYDRSPLIVDAMRGLGIDVKPEDFAVRCDNQTAYWELVRAGCGIGFSQAKVGRADPALEEITLDVAMPALPLWLTAHELVRRTPRVDRVWSLLADGLTEWLA